MGPHDDLGVGEQRDLLPIPVVLEFVNLEATAEQVPNNFGLVDDSSVASPTATDVEPAVGTPISCSCVLERNCT